MRKLPNEVVQIAGTHSLQYVENCFFRRRVGGHDYIGFLIGLVRTSNDARCFIMIHSRVSAESLQESLVGDRIYAGSHAFRTVRVSNDIINNQRSYNSRIQRLIASSRTDAWGMTSSTPPSEIM